MGPYSGQKFAGGKWLGHIVVRACLEAFQGRFFSGSRGQENHGNGSRVSSAPKFAQQAKPVQAWHHDIGQNQIGEHVLSASQSCKSIRKCEHFIPVSEQAPHVLPHIAVVIGQYDSRTASTGVNDVRPSSTPEWLEAFGGIFATLGSQCAASLT